MGEGRQCGRSLLDHIPNKAPEVFGYVPIVIDSRCRRMGTILVIQIQAQQVGHIFDFLKRGIIPLELLYCELKQFSS